MDMTFKLQVFEGPLDLLLYLIEKNKVNIYDIPIVEITAQYMEYVNQMKKDNLDTLSEFLVMAATLLDIKSKMLLPKKEEEEQEQSIEDYLNSLIEFDEKSSETIGLAVSNMRIRAEEQGDTVCPVLYCEVSYSKETYVLVRCPMIKVIFYDAKGCIDNVAMHPVSRIHTGQDIVEMAFKKSTVKNWTNKSKIKVLVTL